MLQLLVANLRPQSVSVGTLLTRFPPFQMLILAASSPSLARA